MATVSSKIMKPFNPTYLGMTPGGTGVRCSVPTYQIMHNGHSVEMQVMYSKYFDEVYVMNMWNDVKQNGGEQLYYQGDIEDKIDEIHQDIRTELDKL